MWVMGVLPSVSSLASQVQPHGDVADGDASGSGRGVVDGGGEVERHQDCVECQNDGDDGCDEGDGAGAGVWGHGAPFGWGPFLYRQIIPRGLGARVG